MHTYESLFIIQPDLDEQEMEKTIANIQDTIIAGGGKILKIDKWGKRQLAYIIQKKHEGFYLLIYFEAPSTLIAELNRRYKLTDAIMRHLVIQLNQVQIAEVFDEESAAKRAARASLAADEDIDDDDVFIPGSDDDELIATTGE